MIEPYEYDYDEGPDPADYMNPSDQEGEDCPVCQGTGINPRGSVDSNCPSCKGSGERKKKTL